MNLQSLLEKIDHLQSEIAAHGKLSSDTLKKIQYRFRLDWNYHSNAMEGSTLTREETRSVMVNNIEVRGKPLKDINEMRGHDNVITDILKMGKGELRISEKRIKDIHKAIIYEDDPTKKEMIGKWKTLNNEIINYRGEKIVFTDHADVPNEMHGLINWLNAETEKIQRRAADAFHPVLLAFEFHLRFVTIHPFYDGNGRTSRIFMNLALISFGYPPVVIKLKEKDRYNQYLADIQAYGGNPDLLYEYLCGLLIHSQELVLDAIAGKDISRPEDLDKKIDLLKAELAEVDKDNVVEVELGAQVLDSIYDEWLSPLLKSFIHQVRKFDDLFLNTFHSVTFKLDEGEETQTIKVRFDDKNEQTIIDEVRQEFQDGIPEFLFFADISMEASYGTFRKGAGLSLQKHGFSIEVNFDHLHYSVSVTEFYPGRDPEVTGVINHLLNNEDCQYVYFGEKGGVYPGGKMAEDTTEVNGEKIILISSRKDILSGKIANNGLKRLIEPRLLHKPLTESEANALVDKLGTTIYDHIDYWTKKEGIR